MEVAAQRQRRARSRSSKWWKRLVQWMMWNAVSAQRCAGRGEQS